MKHAESTKYRFSKALNFFFKVFKFQKIFGLSLDGDMNYFVPLFSPTMPSSNKTLVLAPMP